MGYPVLLPREYHPDFATPRRQPRGRVQIDWSNPMTRGLEWCCLLTPANQHELVTGVPITLTANLSYITRLNNQGIGDFLGSGADGATFPGQQGWATGPATIMSMHRLATGQNGSQSWLIHPGGQDPMCLYHDGWGNRRIILLRRWRTFLHGNAAGYLGADTIYRVMAAHPGGTINSGPARIMVNGDLDSITNTNTETVAAGSSTWTLGNLDTLTNELDGQMFMAGAWSRELSDDEMYSWDRDPYQILKPAVPLLYLVPSAGGAVSITPNDLAHAQSLDASSLTQAHNIAPAELVHAHGLEASTLTQQHNIAPAELAHGHDLEASTLTVSGTLAPAELAHAHLLEASTIAAKYSVTPAELAHAQIIDGTTLVPGGSVAPADMVHTHLLEAVLLTQYHNIAPAELMHAHTIAAANLSNPLAPTTAVLEAALDIHRDLEAAQTIRRVITAIGKLG